MFASVLLSSACGVVFSRNPLYSVLFLIMAFFNAAGLFLLAGAEFLSMILVIVYVGAVAVLFLFVVMMLDIQKEKSRENHFNSYMGMAATLAAVFGIELLFVAYHWLRSPKAGDLIAFTVSSKTSNTEALGELLYTHYFYVFQIAGLILLVAMVGAIILAFNPSLKKNKKRQKINEQLAHNKENSLRVVKVGFHQGIEE
jgi:NADH-quinone oxidoreductase subunit J